MDGVQPPLPTTNPPAPPLAARAAGPAAPPTPRPLPPLPTTNPPAPPLAARAAGPAAPPTPRPLPPLPRSQTVHDRRGLLGTSSIRIRVGGVAYDREGVRPFTTAAACWGRAQSASGWAVSPTTVKESDRPPPRRPAVAPQSGGPARPAGLAAPGSRPGRRPAGPPLPHNPAGPPGPPAWPRPAPGPAAAPHRGRQGQGGAKSKGSQQARRGALHRGSAWTEAVRDKGAPSPRVLSRQDEALYTEDRHGPRPSRCSAALTNIEAISTRASAPSCPVQARGTQMLGRPDEHRGHKYAGLGSFVPGPGPRHSDARPRTSSCTRDQMRDELPVAAAVCARPARRLRHIFVHPRPDARRAAGRCCGLCSTCSPTTAHLRARARPHDAGRGALRAVKAFTPGRCGAGLLAGAPARRWPRRTSGG